MKDVRIGFFFQATVSTMDRRNNKLIFKIHFLEMEERILVDFRLSRVSKKVTLEAGNELDAYDGVIV